MATTPDRNGAGYPTTTQEEQPINPEAEAAIGRIVNAVARFGQIAGLMETPLTLTNKLSEFISTSLQPTLESVLATKGEVSSTDFVHLDLQQVRNQALQLLDQYHSHVSGDYIPRIHSLTTYQESGTSMPDLEASRERISQQYEQGETRKIEEILRGVFSLPIGERGHALQLVKDEFESDVQLQNVIDRVSTLFETSVSVLESAQSTNNITESLRDTTDQMVTAYISKADEIQHSTEESTEALAESLVFWNSLQDWRDLADRLRVFSNKIPAFSDQSSNASDLHDSLEKLRRTVEETALAVREGFYQLYNIATREEADPASAPIQEANTEPDGQSHTTDTTPVRRVTEPTHPDAPDYRYIADDTDNEVHIDEVVPQLPDYMQGALDAIKDVTERLGPSNIIPNDLTFAFDDDNSDAKLALLKATATLPVDATLYTATVAHGKRIIILFPAILPTGQTPNLDFSDKLVPLGYTTMNEEGQREFQYGIPPEKSPLTIDRERVRNAIRKAKQKGSQQIEFGFRFDPNGYMDIAMQKEVASLQRPVRVYQVSNNDGPQYIICSSRTPEKFETVTLLGYTKRDSQTEQWKYIQANHSQHGSL